jgi:uroporphyrinogen-III decarboxylase
MKPRERFQKVMNFEQPDDRLPMIEWAAWWDQTIVRWKKEGLPKRISWNKSLEFFNLDKLVCIGSGSLAADAPQPVSHGAGVITDEASYEKMLPYLYTDAILDGVLKQAQKLKKKHEAGDVIIRLWLDGCFWFPRVLLGIERHLYSFFDQPALIHRINNDLTNFSIRTLEALFPILEPDMIGFAEDMSYNHGPMLSYALFKEFIMPYYQRIVPIIKQHGIKVMIDSDGDITSMIPWMAEAGIEGVYPLEKQAGVDIVKIRQKYPHFLMMGGYDKMVMTQGEAAMRAEFERLLPVMKSGGYIPSVDHQTPPGVSLENYQIYIRLFDEYVRRAVA